MGCELCKPLCPPKGAVCSYRETWSDRRTRGGGSLSNIHLFLCLKTRLYRHDGLQVNALNPQFSSPCTLWNVPPLFINPLLLNIIVSFWKKADLITLTKNKDSSLLDCYLQHQPVIEVYMVMLTDILNGCLN